MNTVTNAALSFSGNENTQRWHGNWIGETPLMNFDYTSAGKYRMYSPAVCVPKDCAAWLMPGCSPIPSFSESVYSMNSQDWATHNGGGLNQNASTGLFCYNYWSWNYWSDKSDGYTYADGTEFSFDVERHPWWIGSAQNTASSSKSDLIILNSVCGTDIASNDCEALTTSNSDCGDFFFIRKKVALNNECTASERYVSYCYCLSAQTLLANQPWVSWYNYNNDKLDSEESTQSYVITDTLQTSMVVTGFDTYSDLNGLYVLNTTALCYNRPVYDCQNCAEDFKLQYFASRTNAMSNDTAFHYAMEWQYHLLNEDLSDVSLEYDFWNGGIYGGPYDIQEHQMYTWRLTKGECGASVESITEDAWALGQCDRFGFNCDTDVRHAAYPSGHNGQWFTYHRNSVNSALCTTFDDPAYLDYITQYFNGILAYCQYDSTGS